MTRRPRTRTCTCGKIKCVESEYTNTVNAKVDLVTRGMNKVDLVTKSMNKVDLATKSFERFPLYWSYFVDEFLMIESGQYKV